MVWRGLLIQGKSCQLEKDKPGEVGLLVVEGVALLVGFAVVSVNDDDEYDDDVDIDNDGEFTGGEEVM